MNGRDQPNWHAAVERADFDPFEADTDGYRWAGGFSQDGRHIGVCALVDGHEVSVDTTRAAVRSDLERRTWITDLVFHHVMADEAADDVPYTVTVRSEVRHVTIGAASHECSGASVEGGARWIGGLTIGDVRVKITTSSPSPSLTLRTCSDASTLPAVPPHGH